MRSILYNENKILYIFISSTKTKSMAMCGNHIQTVKIVINDSIIEQGTDIIFQVKNEISFESD